MAAEVVRGSQRELRSGGRALDRELLALRREEAKLVTDIKAAAKRGDQASAKVLARSLVRLRAQITKLQASAANLRGVATNLTVRQHSTTLHVADVAHHHRLAWCGSNSRCSEPPARLLPGTPPSLPPPPRAVLQTAAAATTVASSMATATGAMGRMQAQLNPARIGQTAQAFARENARMDMAQEMMGDTIDGALDGESAEEDAGELVSQVRRRACATSRGAGGRCALMHT